METKKSRKGYIEFTEYLTNAWASVWSKYMTGYTHSKLEFPYGCNLAIDGDAFCMNIAFAMEKGGSSDVAGNCERYLDSIFDDVGNDGVYIPMYGKGNFRYDLPTIRKYKGNRKKKPKPIYLEPVRDYMLSHHPGSVKADGCEADDLLAEYATANTDVVVAGVDKDLLQIPGYHYNLKTKERTYVTWQEAFALFFKQCLMGDSADNIPGIPGIGNVGSSQIIELVEVSSNPKEYFTMLLSAVHRKYHDYVLDNISEEDSKMFKPLDLARDLLNQNASLLWLWKKDWKNWNDPIPLYVK